MYDPRDWYWIVADKPNAGVFSSARGIYVPADDPTYIAWSGQCAPTRIDTEANLIAVLAAQAPEIVMMSPAGLIAYANRKQAQILGGMISVDVGSAGSPQPVEASLDAFSLGLLNTAIAVAAKNPNATTAWVQANNATLTLNATQVQTIFAVVSAFIQASFATLKGVIDAINAGTITTRTQVDAPPAPIAAWPTNS